MRWLAIPQRPIDSFGRRTSAASSRVSARGDHVGCALSEHLAHLLGDADHERPLVAPQRVRVVAGGVAVPRDIDVEARSDEWVTLDR